MDGGGSFLVFSIFGTPPFQEPAGVFRTSSRPLPSGTKMCRVRARGLQLGQSQGTDVNGWSEGGGKQDPSAQGWAALVFPPGPAKKLQILVARGLRLANIRAPFPLFGIRGTKTARQ